MAIIPLRAYNREIEGMIDNGQLDEAVAHCRHILATFPKHIATYRLLGKAHLEQQRISDATDIFQRVLSAIPDDFIANVGMSIIREDENNLDASIWHMELAYEAQPSNNAIQDELRRLYGRRDGMQPPKVRLTRGALARMYTKGGLLEQAVAELSAAISEDPNRYDLQLLLAGMYFQTSQRIEAVNTCINILKKLPFCLAANQILAVSLPETEGSAIGKNYRQIAISMDPYYAFATKDAITSDQVPENSVNIERLEWKSGIQMNEVQAQPVWATSLGVSLDKQPEEALPEWLKGTEAPATAEPVEKAQPSVSPFIWDTQEVEKIITDDSKPELDIPDWMKDAGWTPAAGETDQKPETVQIEPPTIDVQPQDNLEKADLPDWLRGIAPEDMLEAEAPSSQSVEKDISLPWLEKQQPGPTDSIIQWLEEAKPETPIAPIEPEITPTEILDEEIPDWLKDLEEPNFPPERVAQTDAGLIESSPATPAFIEEPIIVEPSETFKREELPLEGSLEKAFLSETLPEGTETPSASDVLQSEETITESAEELPDWIRELAGETPEAVSTGISAEDLKTELPPIAEVLPEVEISAALEEEPLPESFEMIKESSQVEAQSLMEEPAVNLQGTPEEKVAVEGLIPIESEEIPEPTGPNGENAALAWLAGLAIHESMEEEHATPIEARVIEPSEEVEPETETISLEVPPKIEPEVEETPAIPAEEIPDWIKGLGETPEIDQISVEMVSEAPPESEKPQIEEPPAWLIASELSKDEKEVQGVTLESTEWKEEELPEWIKEISDTTPSEEIPAFIEHPGVEEVPTAPLEPLPEWISEESSISEVGESITTEVQPLESAWVPEVEIAIPSDAEISKEAEIVSTTPLEQSISPTTEVPAAQQFLLDDARKAIDQGRPAQAIEVYAGLIKENMYIEDVIKDIQEALYRFPVDVNLWITLGDAHLRTDELQEALNAYIKAEDLVR